MAEEQHTLRLKAVLDTSDIQAQLNGLNARYGASGASGASAGASGTPALDTSVLNRLVTSMNGLTNTIQQLSTKLTQQMLRADRLQASLLHGTPGTPGNAFSNNALAASGLFTGAAVVSSSKQLLSNMQQRISTTQQNSQGYVRGVRDFSTALQHVVPAGQYSRIRETADAFIAAQTTAQQINNQHASRVARLQSALPGQPAQPVQPVQPIGKPFSGFTRFAVGQGFGVAGDIAGSLGYDKTSLALNIVSKIATMSGAGAAAGSMVPGIGTAVGGSIGAIIGAGQGLADIFQFGKQQKERQAAEQQAGALQAGSLAAWMADRMDNQSLTGILNSGNKEKIATELRQRKQYVADAESILSGYAQMESIPADRAGAVSALSESLKRDERAVEELSKALEMLENAEKRRLEMLKQEQKTVEGLRADRAFVKDVLAMTDRSALNRLKEEWASKMNDATTVVDYNKATQRHGLVESRISALNEQDKLEKERFADLGQSIERMTTRDARFDEERLFGSSKFAQSASFGTLLDVYKAAARRHRSAYARSLEEAQEAGTSAVRQEKLDEASKSYDTYRWNLSMVDRMQGSRLAQLNEQLQGLQQMAPTWGATTGMAALGGNVGEQVNAQARIEQYYSTVQRLLEEIRTIEKEKSASYAN